MNNMKKLASLLLALVMVLAMAVPAMADGETETPATTYTITINNSASGHIYEAYQIFTGTLGANGELGNIQWGANVSAAGQAALGGAAAKAETLKTVADAEAFAKVVAKYLTGTPTESAVVEGKYTISGLTAGYYLVKDKDGSLQGNNDSYTEYLLKVVKNTEASPKGNAPTVQKKVDDKNDSNNTEDAVVWDDSADHDIGDAVPFQLKATLADNVENYLKYKIIFHDTMSAGLTFKEITKVTVDGETVTDGYSSAAVKNNDGTTTLTITFENVKAQNAKNGSVVIVEYTAILNEYAVLGNVGNPNYVYLEYSNNPNWGWDNWNDNDNDDEWDEDETPDDDDDTGKTPEDKVVVFTYKVVVNKVDKDEKPLTGAGFTLYKKNAAGEYIAIGDELTGEAMTQFVWSGLDDGDYKIVETTTPAGYNTIDPIEFTISATHDITWEDEEQTAILTGLSGGDVFTGDVSTGAVSADVVNESGAELPETGGMGTTVIYVIGCLMVAGAAIMLFAKKRAAK